MKHTSLMLSVFVAACTATSTVAPAQLEFTELSVGQHARDGEYPLFELITTPEQLASAWGQIGEAPPTVDFSRHSVIVVLMGRQRSGGHAIAVTSVTRHGDALQVMVRRQVPGAGCMTTMALTSPFQAILVAGRAASAEFTVNTEAVSCQ